MSSRFIVKAVYALSGVAKESGNAYAMKRCVTLADFEPVHRVNKQTGEVLTDRQGSGFVDCEISVSEAFYPKLSAFFANEFSLKRAPVVMDLELSIRSRGRDSETIIVDFAESFKSKHPSLKSSEQQ
jgi:hypothetical protein